MKKDQPSFQFYPSDWLNDSALRSCPPAARGVWIDLLCIMHEGKPRGHLTLPNGGEIDPTSVAHRLQLDVRSYRHLLAILQANGVIYQTKDGVYFSKRMVDDESERKEWRDKKRKQRGSNVPDDVPAMSHPSSSSSSSSKPLPHTPSPNGEGAFSSEDERQNQRRLTVECDYCGWIQDHDHHTKCHYCFKKFSQEEEHGSRHRCP